MSELIKEMPVTVEEEPAEEKDKGPYPHLALRFVLPFTVEMAKSIEMIKPMATVLAEKSKGEYTFAHIWQGIWPGHCHLYMVYAAKSEEGQKKIEDLETGWFELKGIEKEFAGYVVIKWEFGGTTAHIWQAVLEPKYNSTNALQIGLNKIEEKLKWLAIENVTLSSPRSGWRDMAIRLGFEETFSIYRKSLKKDS